MGLRPMLARAGELPTPDGSAYEATTRAGRAKLDRTKPIDAAVALALAVHGGTLDTGGSVYLERGVIVV